MKNNNIQFWGIVIIVALIAGVLGAVVSKGITGNVVSVNNPDYSKCINTCNKDASGCRVDCSNKYKSSKEITPCRNSCTTKAAECQKSCSKNADVYTKAEVDELMKGILGNDVSFNKDSILFKKNSKSWVCAPEDSGIFSCKPLSTCTDTDEGIDYYKKGIVTVSSPKGTQTKEDICHDGDQLDEFYCSTDPENLESFPVSTTRCPKGCSDGACKPLTASGESSTTLGTANDCDNLVNRIVNYINKYNTLSPNGGYRAKCKDDFFNITYDVNSDGIIDNQDSKLATEWNNPDNPKYNKCFNQLTNPDSGCKCNKLLLKIEEAIKKNTFDAKLNIDATGTSKEKIDEADHILAKSYVDSIINGPSQTKSLTNACAKTLQEDMPNLAF